MTALTTTDGQGKMSFTERWKYHRFTLASGSIAYKGGIAALNLATGKVVPASALPNLLVIGKFAEYKDASAADKTVNVDLGMEIDLEWWTNGSSIASTDIGKLCYVADDQTVTLAPAATSAPVAGRIWAVESARGVLVQKLMPAGAPSIKGVLPAHVSNDFILPLANVIPESVYDVGTTAAASFVTLPAGAQEGAKIYFVADGTKNGHTVQFRDVATVITTALIASKRFLVVAIFLGGKWFANAYVSP